MNAPEQEPFSAVILPLDGSVLARQALPYAELLARVTGSKLMLVQAALVHQHAGQKQDEAEAYAYATANASLGAISAELAACGLRAETVAAVAPPAELIAETAQAHPHSLIVMATHGRSGPSRWAMGSVAERVLRQTHVPTLLLTPQTLAAGAPTRLTQRLLVPTDGSPLSVRLLPIAQALARQLGNAVTLLEAVDPAAFYTSGAVSLYGALVPGDLIEQTGNEARANLEAVAARWRAAGMSVDVRVEVGAATTVVEQVTTASDVGWIAMGSHGRGGLGRLVLGSTALKVLHEVRVPVLIGAGLPKEAPEAGARA